MRLSRRPIADLRIGEERVAPDEEHVTAEFVSFLRGLMQERHPEGSIPRSVQTKHHGCVKAEFIVGPDIDSDLRVGLFATPATYPAYVRFASQSPIPKSDRKRDIRGMSIKVCGVAGDMLLEDEPPTQDFLLISSNVFVTADTEAFLRLRRASEPRNIPALLKFFFNPFDLQVRALRHVLRSLRRHDNPLNVRYFSATPYRFGDGAAKYSARPHVRVAGPPRSDSDHHLGEALRHALERHEASFDFCVQLQTDPVRMPVEDAGKAWSEAASPFRKVATIRIPRQRFDSQAQMEFCENLSFTPWHCLVEHRPLGDVNRSRLEIYRALARQRRERSGAVEAEPTGHEIFED